MRNPFIDPPPTVTPSLNRLVIADLPGVDFPEALRGANGYQLLSREALADMMEVDFSPPALGLEPDAAWSVRWQAFTEVLTGPTGASQATAVQLANRFGRRLGFLLLTLHRADPCNQQARADWQPRHWAYWQTIEEVLLGGGLLAGRFGELVSAVATRLLAACGSGLRLRRAPQPELSVLHGLAETMPAGVKKMLVCDFGQSHIKFAVVRRQTEHFVIQQERSCPARCGDLWQMDLSPAAVIAHRDRMIRLIATGIEADPDLPPVAAVAVAAYLRRGHPYPDHLGCYGRLQLLTPNLRQHMRTELQQALKRPVQLTLYHDGAAAALTCWGRPRTAMITLGTALGVGFPPQKQPEIGWGG